MHQSAPSFLAESPIPFRAAKPPRPVQSDRSLGMMSLAA